MGKRKHKSSEEYIKRKIRKLERRLRRRHRNSSDSYSEEPEEADSHHSYSPFSEGYSHWEITNSREASPQINTPSAVHVIDNLQKDLPAPVASTSTADPVPGTSKDSEPAVNLPAEILDILGDGKGKQENFGPKIQEEISKRWGSILCDGLNKDLKKVLMEKMLIPENFQLAKAPKLNIEIASVLSESNRNRDKYLERVQNQLGLAVAALTTLTSSIINNKEKDTIEIVKHLSEANQILLDLHFENTLNRRKLITNSLDKKFLDVIQDVKRDSFLFGENLSEKIKATKSAEKSGLQIKKNSLNTKSTSSKVPFQSENRRGPPRQHQRGSRQGGPKNRTTYRPVKRTQPPNRYQDASRSRARPPPKTQ